MTNASGPLRQIIVDFFKGGLRTISQDERANYNGFSEEYLSSTKIYISRSNYNDFFKNLVSGPKGQYFMIFLKIFI